jgi:serine/threonine protein kinase
MIGGHLYASGGGDSDHTKYLSIGAGGMGEGYQAHDTKLGRDVAIKVYEMHSQMTPSEWHDSTRAQVLASLNHPNIATIHGLEESNNIRRLVMELSKKADPGKTHRQACYATRKRSPFKAIAEV